jgi:hypothetical protein
MRTDRFPKAGRRNSLGTRRPRKSPSIEPKIKKRLFNAFIGSLLGIAGVPS